ncbi:MAG: transcription-repair coupling factor, partial [Bacillota bacterium]
MHSLTQAVWNDQNLERLPAYLEAGASPVLVVGPGRTSRANLAAALRHKTGRPLFVICADETAAENFRRDLELFLEEPCETLTARDMNFYGAEGVSRESEQKRIRTLYALIRNKAPVTVCTVTGLLQRTVPPETLSGAARMIEDGMHIPPEEVEKALLRCGYQRSAQVEGPGQFSRRGGILDFFSPAYDAPVRCEFWGDDVDSMGLFDTDSQRRTERLESCEILPSREILPSMCESEILLDKLHELIKTVERRGGEKLAATLREDAEKLAETGNIAASDRYAALIYPHFVTALDYIPPDALVFLDKPGKVTETAAAFLKQHAEDLSILLESGLIYGKTAQYFLPWEMAAESLKDFALVMSDNFTAGRYPLEPHSIINATIKQLPSYGGSAETAIEDVRHYIGTKFSVVVLAADKRRA